MTVIETGRLVIRRWTEADLDRILAIYSQWEVARWLGATPRAMAGPDEAAAALARWTAQTDESADRYGCWAIEPKDSGVAAGSVLFKPLPNSDGSTPTDIEVGWHLHPDSWGHGYATEAAQAVMDRGLESGLPEVVAVVYPDNHRSIAVCRRLGMTPIGRTDRWYGVEVEAFRRSRADWLNEPSGPAG